MISRRDNGPAPIGTAPDLADELVIMRPEPDLAGTAPRPNKAPPIRIEVSPDIVITLSGDVTPDAFHLIRDWLNGPAQAQLIAELLDRARAK